MRFKKFEEMSKDNLYINLDVEDTYIELSGRTNIAKVGYVIARISSSGEVSLCKSGCSAIGLKIVEEI
jgi:hypothetical protein